MLAILQRTVFKCLSEPVIKIIFKVKIMFKSLYLIAIVLKRIHLSFRAFTVALEESNKGNS